MSRFVEEHGLRHAGVRPVLGPALTGLAGLVGGFLVGRLGVWAALVITGPFEVEDPWNLFGNAIRMLFPMLVAAAGATAGFLAGSVILPMALMLVLTWEAVGKTVAYLLMLLLPVTPLTLWCVVQVGTSSETPGSARAALWFGAVVVGGVTPAAARWFAIRRRRVPT